MAITKLSSREFNQDTRQGKEGCEKGARFYHGSRASLSVLITAEEYQRITGGQKSLADLLAMPEAAEIEFDPPRLTGNLHGQTDLS